MNITLVESKIAVSCKATGVDIYDFNFELFFRCSHPYQLGEEIPLFLRVGAPDEYTKLYQEFSEVGLSLVNTPAEHFRASELSAWYPLLKELTPRSEWYESPPSVQEVESKFDWPVFIKGSRQTAKHSPELCWATDRESYSRICREYQSNAILHWQSFVIREKAQLEPVRGQVPGKVAPSLEYRTFWWKGKCVGYGEYWYQLDPYPCADIQNGLIIAEQAAKLLNVPFLVVDIARTTAGQWIVIECNDAQESGYARIQPLKIWREIIALECA